MLIEEISFKNDKAKYLVPTWDQLDVLALKIAKQIKDSEVHLDMIVALAKGAWPMGRSLMGYSDVKELASLGVKFYKGINERLDKPEIYQEIPISVSGKNVLIFDDIADTGESLVFSKEYLSAKDAKSVSTATLLMKPHSVITPDFVGLEVDSWVIFPCERREMIDLLGKNWREQGRSESEIMDRYQKLGFMEVYRSVF